MNNSRGRRFQFTILETSARFAKGISMLRTIAWSILDVWNLEKLCNSEDLQRPPWDSVVILIFVDKQAVPATFMDFLQALALQIPLEIVKMQ